MKLLSYQLYIYCSYGGHSFVCCQSLWMVIEVPEESEVPSFNVDP